MGVTVVEFNGAGDSQQVASSDLASFVADHAYVVLCEDSTSSIFVWRGQATTAGACEAAAAHAAELLVRSGAKLVGSLLEGEETEDFKKLFPAIYAVPDDGREEDQQAGPEDDPALEAGILGQSKKKKRKNKRSKSGGGAASTAGPAAIEEKTLVSAAEPSAPPAPSAKAPAPVASIAGVPAVAEEAVAPAEEPVSSEAAPIGGPKGARPAVAPTQDSEYATEEQEPAAAESVAVDEKVAPAKPAPAVVPGPAKHESSEPATQVAAASQQKELKPARFREQTGGVGYLDPLSGKEANVKSYLADSAKAWGGGTIPPPSSAGVVVPAGSTFFSFEELKGMRPESGIDMTSKESYLSAEDFVKVLKMDRETWMAQPAWRRQTQKKAVGLW